MMKNLILKALLIITIFIILYAQNAEKYPYYFNTQDKKSQFRVLCFRSSGEAAFNTSVFFYSNV